MLMIAGAAHGSYRQLTISGCTGRFASAGYYGQMAVHLLVPGAVPTVDLVLLCEGAVMHTDGDVMERPGRGIPHDQKLAYGS